MIHLAVALLAVALIAPLASYGFIADYTFEAAKTLFFVFVVLAIIVFIVDSFRRRTPV